MEGIMYTPARVGDDVLDVLLDTKRHLVWLVCAHLPAPRVRVVNAATDERLVCVKSSSIAGECPSALLAYTYVAEPAPHAVLVNGVEVCLTDRLEVLRARFATLPRRAVVVTTLYKHDTENLQPYIDYYISKKAHGLLLYDNNDTPAFEHAIPWPLPYWKSPGVHNAQSTHLTHAALVCALYGNETWLLNVDLDEYLVSPLSLPDIAVLADGGGCDAVGFRSQWVDSEAHGVLAASKAPHTIRKAPFVFTWPHRAKFMQRYALDDPLLRDIKKLHRGIHRPFNGTVTKMVVLEPEEGTLLHFAFASGAARPPGIFCFTTHHQDQSNPASEAGEGATPPP